MARSNKVITAIHGRELYYLGACFVANMCAYVFIVVGDSTARDGGKPIGKKSSDLSHILGTSDTVPNDAQLDLMS